MDPKVRALYALIACLGVNTLAYAMSYPLLSLAMHHKGFEPEIIGLSAAFQSFSIFVFAPFIPKIISRFGPYSVMVFNLLLMVLVFLLFGLAEPIWMWFVLRFFLGFTNNLMWIAGESMVNHLTDEANRGRTIAKYAMALSAGFAMGPFVLSLTGSQGWTPFVAAAMIIIVSALPLLFLRNQNVEYQGQSKIGYWSVLKRAPVPMLTNLAFAASSGIMITFFPIYGIRLGLEENFTLYLITIAAVGGFFIQPLMGYLADKVDRLILLSIMLTMTVLLTSIMSILIVIPVVVLIYMFIYGGIRTSLYGISVTLMGQRFRGVELATASALFNLMWGIGNGIGPFIGGYAIDWWNPHGVPGSMGFMIMLIIPLPLIIYYREKRTTVTDGKPITGDS